MKIKCGFIVVAAGVLTMLSGLALKEPCEKCGCGLFGFGLAHVFLGALSLLKSEKGIPDKISIPMSNVEIDMN